MNILGKYTEQILGIPHMHDHGEYVPLTQRGFLREENDPKIIAYYLPQFYPFKENDAWWGKGTTEWNNVGKAVPQFLGHYQPRLPGELGYYDLRLKENISRQIELAKLYGVYGFCYYYYWFDGKRLLDKPVDLFLESKDLDFPFCLCWVNDSWTKRFCGRSDEVIMKQNYENVNDKNFIIDLKKYFLDQRYLEIQGKKVLLIYKPNDIPELDLVIEKWRRQARCEGVGEIYIIGIDAYLNRENIDLFGMDAFSEFQPKSLSCLEEVQFNSEEIDWVNCNFCGSVLSYKKIVEEKMYFENALSSHYKLYKAVMPMWDNTARRDNAGIVFHGSTPKLYGEWLDDIIRYTARSNNLDDQMIFLNAWNEWGEGAYLEPDGRFGYAYLKATRDAIEKNRNGRVERERIK